MMLLSRCCSKILMKSSQDGPLFLLKQFESLIRMSETCCLSHPASFLTPLVRTKTYNRNIASPFELHKRYLKSHHSPLIYDIGAETLLAQEQALTQLVHETK